MIIYELQLERHSNCGDFMESNVTYVLLISLVITVVFSAAVLVSYLRLKRKDLRSVRAKRKSRRG